MSLRKSYLFKLSPSMHVFTQPLSCNLVHVGPVRIRVRRVQFLRAPRCGPARAATSELRCGSNARTNNIHGDPPGSLPPSLPGPRVAHATSLTALFFAHHGLIWRSDRFIPTDIPQWFRRPRKLPSEMRVALCSVVVSVSVDYSVV